jgi:metallo-beta-lactamase family protein
MKFISHGAAREVTGTCHELQVGDKRILLDCGLFQGSRAESTQKNATFTFDPKSIDALILTHAHMDHVGRIPLLWKRGFRGPVYTTHASRDLAAVMLKDGGYIQEQDEMYFRKHLKKSMIPSDGPLYTQEDAAACMELFVGRNYVDAFDVVPGVRASFLEAGHILGAAMVVLDIEEGGVKKRVGFSGDIGRPMLPIIRDPAVMPPVDLLICESTYGDRRHDDISTAKDTLRDVVIRTAKRGGKLLIPAFSLERTQEILYDLHVLWDAKEIPPVPIVVDSPLASSVTDVFMKHPECYDQEIFEQFLSHQHHPFQFSLVRYTNDKEESKALNRTPGPLIIMAGSGMCEAGRIRHHIRNEIGDTRNALVAVGYMAGNTLGARLLDPAVSEVKIFDEFYPKKAEILSINAYSGHADRDDLDRYVAAVTDVKDVILVHGEPAQMDPFAERIRTRKPGVYVHTPERGQELVF